MGSCNISVGANISPLPRTFRIQKGRFGKSCLKDLQLASRALADSPPCSTTAIIGRNWSRSVGLRVGLDDGDPVGEVMEQMLTTSLYAFSKFPSRPIEKKGSIKSMPSVTAKAAYLAVKDCAVAAASFQEETDLGKYSSIRVLTLMTALWSRIVATNLLKMFPSASMMSRNRGKVFSGSEVCAASSMKSKTVPSTSLRVPFDRSSKIPICPTPMSSNQATVVSLMALVIADWHAGVRVSSLPTTVLMVIVSRIWRSLGLAFGLRYSLTSLRKPRIFSMGYS